MDKLYTVKEVSEILGMNQETIRRYLRNGIIRTIRVGGGRKIHRITRDDLDDFIQRGRENTPPKIEKRVHLRGIIKGTITADNECEIDQAIDEVKKIWESRQV